MIALIPLLSVLAHAKELSGEQIAIEQKNRDTGWLQSSSDFNMVLKNQKGDTNIREMRIQTLEVTNDGDKSLIIFDRPNDVKGTVFLNHSHINKADEQWLYLPSIRRTKAIASRNKSGPFVGSEFSFEDLSSFELNKYTFNNLGSELIGGIKTYKVEQIPVDEYSGYEKRIAWIDAERFIPIKIDFYDRKGSRLKSLTFSDYQLYQNKYWRAHKMLMFNHHTNKSTQLLTDNFIFNQQLNKRNFDSRRLGKVR